MRIAQVSPLHESVPPRLYGGTERVVSYLTEELVRLGHDVTLFASADSRTRARLVPMCPAALRLGGGWTDPCVAHMLMMEQVFARADRFDVIHFHTDYLHYPLVRRHDIPTLTTLHGRLDLPDYQPLYREYSDIPLVSISNAQRAPIPWANWDSTVYHGLPQDLYPFDPEPGEYLAFAGRFSPEKRPDLAIQIARRAGIEIRLAAKVEQKDREYFDRTVRPILDQPGVVFLGEINEDQKREFYGRARALLFPIDWPEPFGLVMIEAMACGTPVIATRRGSVPEIIEHGVSGFIVDSADEAVHAARHAGQLSRRRVRECFEHRFTAHRMARDYVAAYRRRADAALPDPRSGRARRSAPGRPPEPHDPARPLPGAAG